METCFGAFTDEADMSIKEYRKPDGKIDFKRLAKVTGGWTDSEERIAAIERAMRSAYRVGVNNGRKQGPLLDDMNKFFG